MLSRRTFIALPAGVAGMLALQQAPAHAGVSWPSDQVLPTFPPPRRLDVANVHDLHGDDQALLATLQGVVNRREPRLYFIFGDDPSDPAWLDTLDLPTRHYDDPMSLIAKYRIGSRPSRTSATTSSARRRWCSGWHRTAPRARR